VKVDKERRMDDTKLLWHMDRVHKYFQNDRVAPIHIDMGIAKFCNVKCVFCYGKYQEMTKTFIQREALLNAIRDAAEIGVKSIAFIGDGEPTCNPHMYEALELGASLGLDMATSTNGVLLDNDKRIHSILKSCKWMRFCISAGTKEGYIKIHGVDKFDRVVKNIERTIHLRDQYGYKCEIGLQSVFVPTLMAEEMLRESEFAVRVKADYFVIKQCSLPDDGETGMVQFDVKAYDSEHTINVLKQCESLSNERTKIIPKWNIMQQKGKRPYKGCPAVPFISEMSGNGDWFPCGFMFGNKEHFQQYKFGNVHTERIRDIFNSARYWEILRKMSEEFNVQKQCQGACRLDKCNEFIYTYLNKPRGINFI